MPSLLLKIPSYSHISCWYQLFPGKSVLCTQHVCISENQEHELCHFKSGWMTNFSLGQNKKKEQQRWEIAHWSYRSPSVDSCLLAWTCLAQDSPALQREVSKVPVAERARVGQGWGRSSSMHCLVGSAVPDRRRRNLDLGPSSCQNTSVIEKARLLISHMPRVCVHAWMNI